MDRIEELSARLAEVEAHNVRLMEHVKGQDVFEQQYKSALASKDDEITHHLLVLGESATSEAEKDKRIEELEALVSRGRAQIAVMGGAGDRLTSENAELREKWHSFSKATLGEWAELKKERDTLKEEVAELRESAKRADLWKDRSE